MPVSMSSPRWAQPAPGVPSPTALGVFDSAGPSWPNTARVSFCSPVVVLAGINASVWGRIESATSTNATWRSYRRRRFVQAFISARFMLVREIPRMWSAFPGQRVVQLLTQDSNTPYMGRLDSLEASGGRSGRQHSRQLSRRRFPSSLRHEHVLPQPVLGTLCAARV